MSVSKRVFQIFGILFLAVIVYAVGAYTEPPDFDALSKSTPPPPMTPPPEEIDPVYTELGAPGIIEYGDSHLMNNNINPLHAYIRYPQAGNDTDEDIYKWAHDFYNEIAVRYNTGVDFAPVDFGEINIQFDSYLIDNRYAGIHQYGEFSYTTLEHPQEILKTFNIDLTGFRFLEPHDILDLENPEAVLSLLSLRLLVEHPGTDGYHVFIDESWLSYLLITHEGIKVFLPYNEFLPDSFDTLTVTLPYEDLGSSLLIRQGAPLPAMPTPMPDPTPLPAPGPDDDPDGDPDGNPDDDPDVDPDGDPDGDPNGGPDGDPDGDPDVDPDSNPDSDPDSTPDSDSDGEEPPPPVPPQRGPIDPSKPMIALSFDDGPGMYTNELLNLFDQYGVRATFFTVGNLVHTKSEVLRRAVDMDCEVAGQSWNHKNLAKMNADDVRLQLETTKLAIDAVTGTEMKIFRPPYGAVSDTMKAVSEELGLSMINWSLDSEDWRGKDADEIYHLIMEQVDDKAIILSHDIYGSTLEAYKKLIPELLLQGYQLVTVSELVKHTNWRLEPGQIYYDGQKVELPS